MKKVILYVFSGTGNTQLVAELYKKYLTDCETTIYMLGKRAEGESVPSPLDYDLVGLGYPVHGFNAPLVMNNFCKCLPAIEAEAGRKKTFIFKSNTHTCKFKYIFLQTTHIQNRIFSFLF